MGSTQCEPIRWHSSHYTSRCPNKEFQTGLREDPESRLYAQHKRAVAMGDVQNANTTHWMQTSHNMNCGVAHVVDKSNSWRERKIKESVYIRTRKTYNLDSGSSLSPVWNSLIGHREV